MEQCNIIENYNSHQTYSTVNRCPESMSYEDLSRNCSKVTEIDLASRIPVTDVYTGQTFQNIYCFLCYHNHSNVARWHLSISCGPTEKTANYNEDADEDKTRLCKPQIIKPKSVQLEQCSKIVREKRELKESKSNFISEPRTDNPPWTYGFTTLFNFGANGDTHWLLTSNMEEFLSKSSCTEETQIFNPFTLECLELNCPRSEISLNGKCKKANSVTKSVPMVCVTFEIYYEFYESTNASDYEWKLVNLFLKKYEIDPLDITIPLSQNSGDSLCPGINLLQFNNSWQNNDETSVNFYLNQPHFAIDNDTDMLSLMNETATCLNLKNKTSHKITLSVKFAETHPQLEKLRNKFKSNKVGLKNNALGFLWKKKNGQNLGFSCLSTFEKQFLHHDWCQGIRKEYFNDEFELLSLTKLRIKSTNQTYSASQFQYTLVTNNGTIQGNISKMASTCDTLPYIKNQSSCIKLAINDTHYDQQQDGSIKVKSFDELSKLQLPYESEPRKPIKSVFTPEEYEYIQNDTGIFGEQMFENDSTVAICIPEELIMLFIELELWNRVNIKPSCSYLQKFAWGSSVTGFVFSSISMLAMIAVLITYTMFRTLRTLPGISLMNLTCAIMLSQITFLAAMFAPNDLDDSNRVCFTMAVLTHYCTLSSFMWMNVMAYSSYRSFGADLKTRLTKLNKRHLIANSLYGWGIPALIVAICVAVDIVKKEEQLIAYGVVSGIKVFDDLGADGEDKIQIRYRRMSTCWIGNSKAALVIFGAPMVYSMIVNLTLFIKTCYGNYKILFI